MTTERRYLYRPKPLRTLLSILLLATGAPFLFVSAYRAESRLSLWNLIELDVQATSIFFYLSAAFFAGVLMTAIASLIIGFSGKRYIVIDRDTVTVPDRWHFAEARLDFADIAELTVQTLNDQTVLKIMHGGGKTVVAAGMLRDMATFKQVCEIIAWQTREARG